MKNKIFLTFVAVFCSLLAFNSCSTDDTTNSIDQEWKTYNEKQITEVAANSAYRPLPSLSGNGNVYWKSFKFAPDTKSSLSTKITQDGKPYFTDSVAVRYEGWYFQKDGTKYIFKSTEANNGVLITGRINNVNIFNDGLSTMLQNMERGGQVQVCIPYQLGFGIYGSSLVPGYTALWYNIKLEEIYPDNPGEFK